MKVSKKGDNVEESEKVDSRGRVLVADDNPAILDSTTKLLRKLGYEVETESNGEAVLARGADLPSAILLDVRMTGMDGKDVCRKLKEDEKTAHIAVILFSASRETGVHAKEPGADDFIEKPFNFEDLTEKLDKYLASSKT